MSVKDNKMVDTIVYVYDQAYISGGAAKIVIGEAVKMKEKGYRVIYFSAIGPICEELLAAQIEVICLNEQHIANTKNLLALMKGIYNPNSYKKMCELLETLNVEKTVVHIHGWTKALSSAVFKATFDKHFRTYVTLHEYFTICQNGGLYNYKKQTICTKKCGSLACMMCDCDKRNYFQKMYRNVRHIVQSHVLKSTRPHPIYITKFSKKIIQPNLPYKAKSFELTNFVELTSANERVQVENNEENIFIGRLSKEKGLDLFCEAVNALDAKGTVIGSGPLLDEYKKMYPNINFVGWKNSIEMRDYLKKARALVVTSKWYETMGLTIIEMQQYGIPCIVPRQCAGSEYISDGKTGMLYDIGNISSLTEALRKSQNEEVIHKISVEFYRSINIKKFSIEEHANNLIKIYETDIL